MLAAELAQGLSAPFDLLPVQPFELPCDSRARLGAVGLDGVCVIDDALADQLDVETDTLSTLRRDANAALEQLNQSLRGLRPLPRVEGRTVILVDDFVASTLPIRAALLYLRQHEPRRVVLAAPLVTTAAMRELRPLVDEIVALETPKSAPSLSDIYGVMEAPGDAEVRRVLGVAEPLHNLIPRETMND